MPVVRIGQDGEGEGEGLGRVKPVGGTGDLNRVVSNMTLADHVGKFVAGEVAAQFKNENLADMLKGKNMIMVSGSWG